MKKFLSSVVALFGVFGVAAQTTMTVNGLKYDLYTGEEGNHYAILSGREISPDGELVIPGELTWGDVTYPVTEIADYVLNWCTSLTSVEIPSSVTRIGYYAFDGCYSLISLEIPSSVTVIEGGAFADCYNLKSVSLPESLYRLGNEVFRYCNNLETFTLPASVKELGFNPLGSCSSLKEICVEEGNENFVDYDGVLYDRNMNFLIQYPAGKQDISYSLPEIVEINPYAFSGNSYLETVTLPASLLGFGDFSFQSCRNLREIIVEEGNKNFSSYEGVLYNTDQTALIYYPMGRSGEFTVPETVTRIWAYAARNCQGLTSVILPNSVKNIGEYAFSSCSNLTAVTLPSDIEEIAYGSFEYCDNLIKVIYPTVQPIECNVEVFDCWGMSIYERATLFVAPGGVENARNTEPWLNFQNITDDIFIAATVIDGVKYEVYQNTAGGYAVVTGNSGSVPSELIIPASIQVDGAEFPVTEIAAKAFVSCGTINSVVIPEGVTRIGREAFNDCYNLKEVTIPASIEKIGDYAFAACGNLNKVCYPTTAPVTGSNEIFAWGDVYSRATLYVAPGGLETARNTEPWLNFGNIKDEIPLGKIESEENGLVYDIYSSISGDYAILSGYTREISDIVIPESIVFQGNSYPVTEIGINAFYNCDWIKSVKIPNSVTIISDYAFYDCDNIASLNLPDYLVSIGNYAFFYNQRVENFTLPDTLEKIGNYAFRYCNRITAIYIPASVTEIGEAAFAPCNSLQAIEVAEDNEAFTAVDGVLFDKSLSELKQCPVGKSGSYVIPASVNSIDAAAFMSCRDLISVEIPGTVNNIGYNAFWECGRLNKVVYNTESPITIDYSIFSNQTFENATLYVPAGVKELAGQTVPWSNFKNISEDVSTGEVELDGVIYDLYSSAEPYAYVIGHAPEIEGEVIIPETVIGNDGKAYKVIEIKAKTFYECRDITSIMLPATLTKIGAQAFQYCGGLTSVVIPESVTEIGDNSFYDCWNLGSVVLSEGLTKIGNRAFAECGALKSVTIPASVMEIASYAFGNCYSLDAITVAEGNVVYSSVDGVLFNKEQTTLIQYPCGKPGGYKIPNTVISIGENAFNQSQNLTSVVIPNSVTAIGYNAFYGCSNLLSIEIPASVTEFGYNAFGGCSKLNKVVYNTDNPLTINDAIFSYQTYDNATLYVPEGVKELAGQTVPWSNFKNISDDVAMGEFELDGVIYDLYSSAEPYAYVVGHTPEIEGEIAIRTSITGNDGKEYKVTEIKSNAFYDCRNITSVLIPATVTKIGTSAFQYCGGLTSVVIPNSVTEIGSNSFYNCWNLQNVEFSEGLTMIGNYAFSACNALNSIYIPASVTEIGYRAFSYCRNLSSISVADNNEIYASADGVLFNKEQTELIQYPCAKTGVYKIPATVVSIASCAFLYAYDLTTVIIPESVSNFGYDAFWDCYNLKTVIYNTTTPAPCDYDMFIQDIFNNATLYVEPGGLDNARSTKPWSNFQNIKELTSMVLPEAVELNNADIILSINSEQKLDIVFTPESEDLITEITWTVENPEIAEIYPVDNWWNPETETYDSAYYAIRSRDLGNTAFIGKTINGLTVTGTVAVEGINIYTDDKNSNNTNISVGEQCKLTVLANPKPLLENIRLWSENESVASVSEEGIITGNAPGYVWIIAEAEVDGKVYRDEQYVTVHPDNEIILGTDYIVLYPGNYVSLNINAPLGQTWSWEISDPEVVGADLGWYGSFLHVHYEGVGDATITVTTENGYSASCRVRCCEFVTDLIPDTTEVKLSVGMTHQIEVTVYPEDTNQIIEWYSSDYGVAEVDENGVITAVGLGQAEIIGTVIGPDWTRLSVSILVNVDELSGISELFMDGETADIYNMNGILVKANATMDDYKKLAKGIYIIRKGNVSMKTVINGN